MVKAKITGMKKLLNVWEKSAKTRNWGTGSLRKEINTNADPSFEYCLLGALYCEQGIDVRGNNAFYNAGSHKIPMEFSDILVMYNIPVSHIVNMYQCPICGETDRLVRIILHLNDLHGINFKKALKTIPNLKLVKEKDFISKREYIHEVKSTIFYNFWESKDR